jgi:very-short-patch-repair endonuclease
MFNCPRCNQEYPSYNSLSKHTRTAYKLSGEQLYREYHDIKEIPTCRCGCGTLTKWRIDRGYGEYVSGHNARGKNNPMLGKTHSETARRNISHTRKEKFANGEYDFIDAVKWSENQKNVWKRIGYKEKMKETRTKSGWHKKLSDKMSGENHPFYGKKRPDHSKLMKTPEMMEKIFAKRSMTDIEQLMMTMLEQTNIPYHSQFFIKHNDDTYAYDFKLKDLPILIEVDGDYWHGGPSTNNHVPFVNDVKEKDILKTEIAQQHGYTVLRFWGSDVKERPFWVIQQLLSHINPSYKTPY